MCHERDFWNPSSALSGRQSRRKPARLRFAGLVIAFFIFYLFPQKEQVIITQYFPPHQFGRFINYNLGERPHVRLQMRLIKDIF